MNYFYLINTLLGFVGFYIAYHIYKHKMFQKPLTCPFHLSCDVVIHSKFGKTFGIDTAALGIFYYLFIAFSYIYCMIYNPTIFDGINLSVFLTGISFLAAAFSLYLISIMQFILRQWCSWCIGSAFTSLTIAAVSFVNLLG